MRFNKLIFVISIVLVTGLVFFSCKIKLPGTRDLNEILESGRLLVVLEKSSVGFTASKDSVYGFQYEIVKAFADSLGVELEVNIEPDITKALESLKNGEDDIVANFIPLTTDKKILFTIPLISSRQMLVQHIVDDTIHKIITNQLDLASETIYLPVNSFYKSRIINLSNEIADTISIVEIKKLNTEQLIKMVSEGKIKHTICPERLADKYKSQYSNLDISLPIGFTQEHSWAVRKESVILLDKLNEYLKDFIGSTAYWELYRKYYR